MTARVVWARPYTREHFERRRQPLLAVVVGAGRGAMVAATEAGEYLEATTVAGCEDVWRALGTRRRKGAREWAVYSTVPMRQLLTTCGATRFVGRRRRGRIFRLSHEAGAVVRPLYAGLGGVNAHDAAMGFFDAVDWLVTHRNIRVDCSLSTLAWNLWRSTLTGPAAFHGDREVGRGAFFGGRQEAPKPGKHKGYWYHDLAAAYPAAMISEPIGTGLVEADPARGLSSGIAEAVVSVPAEGEWFPLPLRVCEGAIVYGPGTQRGLWSHRELRMAAEMGVYVRVERSWEHRRQRELFGQAWHDAFLEARQLAPPASRMAKAIVNATWGRFAMEAGCTDTIVWSDFDGTPFTGSKVVPDAEPRGPLPIEYAGYVASEIAARVRERLWREGLSNVAGTIYCDTDAFMAPAGAFPQRSTSIPEPGEWRIKAEMEAVEIHAPQVYRWRPPEGRGWRYTVSGVPADTAAANFATFGRHYVRRPALPPSFGSPVCIPAMHLRQAERYVGKGWIPELDEVAAAEAASVLG